MAPFRSAPFYQALPDITEKKTSWQAQKVTDNRQWLLQETSCPTDTVSQGPFNSSFLSHQEHNSLPNCGSKMSISYHFKSCLFSLNFYLDFLTFPLPYTAYHSAKGIHFKTKHFWSPVQNPQKPHKVNRCWFAWAWSDRIFFLNEANETVGWESQKEGPARTSLGEGTPRI